MKIKRERERKREKDVERAHQFLAHQRFDFRHQIAAAHLNNRVRNDEIKWNNQKKKWTKTKIKERETTRLIKVVNVCWNVNLT